jgi:hypothetical protein
MVIEAVIEDIGLKQRIFADLEAACAPHAILATNTSTIDIELVGAKLKVCYIGMLVCYFLMLYNVVIAWLAVASLLIWRQLARHTPSWQPTPSPLTSSWSAQSSRCVILVYYYVTFDVILCWFRMVVASLLIWRQPARHMPSWPRTPSQLTLSWSAQSSRCASLLVCFFVLFCRFISAWFLLSLFSLLVNHACTCHATVGALAGTCVRPDAPVPCSSSTSQ